MPLDFGITTTVDAASVVSAKNPLAVVTGNVRRPVEVLEVFLGDPFTSPDIRIVNADTLIQFQGKLYTPASFSRDRVQLSLSDSVDLFNVSLDNADGAITKFFKENPYRGKRVTLRKIYRPNPTRIASTVLFDGRLQTMEVTDQNISFQVSSIVETFNQKFPTRTFATRCEFTWGEAACGVPVQRAEHNHYGFAQRGSTSLRILDPTLVGFDEGYWDFGNVTMLEGPNAGLSRPVARYDNEKGAFFFRYPFENATLGYRYKLRRGCKKTKEDCGTRFKNLPRYGGFAEVPEKPVLR